MALKDLQSGFSLVELSIVLVILGLLTGGILAGQNLISSAELNKIIATNQKYQVAFRAFQEKYMALPGDFESATRFWGRQQINSYCLGSTSVTTAQGTCDGDGNGETLWVTTGFTEHLRVFEHLSKAGLIEGSYALNPTDGLSEAQRIGIVIPPTVRGAGILFGYVGNGGKYSNFYRQTGHFLKFGIPDPSSSQLSGGMTNPVETWSIDKKIDDGLPGIGAFVVSRRWAGTGSECETSPSTDYCVAGPWIVGGDGTGSNYNLNASKGKCSLCEIYFRAN